ncbi:MAG: hypothetical protein WCG25_09975, partial [bacterium]
SQPVFSSASASIFAHSSQSLYQYKSNVDHIFNQPVFDNASASAIAHSYQISLFHNCNSDQTFNQPVFSNIFAIAIDRSTQISFSLKSNIDQTFNQPVINSSKVISFCSFEEISGQSVYNIKSQTKSSSNFFFSIKFIFSYQISFNIFLFSSSRLCFFSGYFNIS